MVKKVEQQPKFARALTVSEVTGNAPSSIEEYNQNYEEKEMEIGAPTSYEELKNLPEGEQEDAFDNIYELLHYKGDVIKEIFKQVQLDEKKNKVTTI